MDWFNVLEAVRKIAPKEDSQFTSISLANAVKLKPIAGKSIQQTSAHWISKFVKWGYAKSVGTEPNPGHKPLSVYVLTKFGRDVERQIPKLDQLRDLIRQFEAARGTAKEAATWKALIALCDKLDREEFGVD